MYQYPYGDAQQLNLDWILNKIQEIQNMDSSTLQLKAIANALISLSYSDTSAYAVNAITYNDTTQKLYRCNTAIGAGGEAWNPAHWDEILLAPVVSNLVVAVANMSSDDVFNNSTVAGIHVTDALDALSTAITAAAQAAVTNVRYNSHKLQQRINGSYSDIIKIEDTPSNNSDRLASSKALYDYEASNDTTVNNLASSIGGKIPFSNSEATIIEDGTDYDTLTTAGDYLCPTVTSAATMTNAPSTTAGHRLWVLYNVSTSRITQIAFVNGQTVPFAVRNYSSNGWSIWNEPDVKLQKQIANYEDAMVATKSYTAGDYIIVQSTIYRATTNISNGASLTVGTNISDVIIGDELKTAVALAESMGRAGFVINANTTRSFNLPNSQYGIFFTIGAATTTQELVIFRASSTGTISLTEVNTASGITVTKTTNTITIANGTSYTVSVIFFCLSGGTITAI